MICAICKKEIKVWNDLVRITTSTTTQYAHGKCWDEVSGK